MLKIWDAPTRLYHWLQAILFFGLAISAYGGLGKELHQSIGLFLIVLLLWRFGWGLFGSETARFSQFVRSPHKVLKYIRDGNDSQAGHNPLGALMIVALLLSLFLQGSMGLMLSDWVEGKTLLGRSTFRTLGDVHAINALILLTLSTIHIVTVLILTTKGRSLIKPMITGLAKISDQIQQPKMASNLKAIAWLICCVMGIAGLIALLQ